MPVLREAHFSCFLFGGDNLDEHRSDGFKTLTENFKKHEDAAKHLKNVINLAMLGTVSKVYVRQGYKYNEKVGKTEKSSKKLLSIKF
jgi:hypothetical protein